MPVKKPASEWDVVEEAPSTSASSGWDVVEESDASPSSFIRGISDTPLKTLPSAGRAPSIPMRTIGTRYRSSGLGLTSEQINSIVQEDLSRAEAKSTPLIPFSRTPLPGGSLESRMKTPAGKQSMLTGAAHGVTKVAESLTTPSNVEILGTMAVAPELAIPAGAYFGYEMGTGGASRIKEGWDKLSTEPGTGVSEMIEGGLEMGMAALGVKHSARSGRNVVRDYGINKRVQVASDSARTADDLSQPFDVRESAANRANQIQADLAKEQGTQAPLVPKRPKPAGALPPAPPDAQPYEMSYGPEVGPQPISRPTPPLPDPAQGRKRYHIPETTAPIEPGFIPLRPGEETAYIPPARQLPAPFPALPPSGELAGRPVTQPAQEGGRVEMPPPLPPGQTRMPWVEPNEVRHPGTIYPDPFEEGVRAESSRLRARLNAELGKESPDQALVSELQSAVKSYERQMEQLAQEREALRPHQPPAPGVPLVPETKVNPETGEVEIGPGKQIDLPINRPHGNISEQATIWDSAPGDLEFGYEIPSYTSDLTPDSRVAAGERARMEEISNRPPIPEPPPKTPADLAREQQARLEGMGLRQGPRGDQVVTQPATAFIGPQEPLPKRVESRAKLADDARFDNWVKRRFTQEPTGEFFDTEKGNFVPESQLRHIYDREKLLADQAQEAARKAEAAAIQGESEGLGRAPRTPEKRDSQFPARTPAGAGKFSQKVNPRVPVGTEIPVRPTATPSTPEPTSPKLSGERPGLDMSRDPFAVELPTTMDSEPVPELPRRQGRWSQRGSFSGKSDPIDPNSLAGRISSYLRGERKQLAPEDEVFANLDPSVKKVLSPEKMTRVQEFLSKASNSYHALMSHLEPQHQVRRFLRASTTPTDLKKRTGLYLEHLRQYQEAPRRAAEGAVEDMVNVVSPVNSLGPERAPQGFKLFTGQVIAADIVAAHEAASRGKRRMELPAGTTIEQWKKSLLDLKETTRQLGMEKEVNEAIARHNALTRKVGEGLAKAGRISKDAALRPYYTHKLLYEGTPDILSLPPVTGSDLKTPSRSYTKVRQGSKALIDVDYLNVMTDHLTRVYLDNMTDNFVAKWGQKWDVKRTLTRDELANLRSQMITGELKPFQAVEIRGQRYVAWTPLRQGEAIKGVPDGLNPLETAIVHVANQMIEGADKSRKVFLVPESIAASMQEFYTGRRFSNAILQGARQATNLYKKGLFGSLGWRYIFNNFIGDSWNVMMDDPYAFTNYKRAARMLVKPTEAERTILDTAINEGLSLARPGSVETLFEPSNIKYQPEVRNLLSKWDRGKFTLHKYNPFHVARAVHAKFEGVPRLAKYLTDMDRITKKGELVHTGIPAIDLFAKRTKFIGNDGKVSTNIDLEHLDPTSREAVARAARVVLTDYGDVTQANNILGRGLLFPVSTWFYKNMNFYRMQFKNAPVATTAKVAAPLIGIAVWNNTGDRKKVEDSLPDHIKESAHINTGYKTSEGKDIVISMSFPPHEALKGIGLGNTLTYIAQLSDKKLTPEEAIKKQFHDVVDASPAGLYTTLFTRPEGKNMIYQQFTPMLKTFSQIWANKNDFGGRIWSDSDGDETKEQKRVSYAMEKLLVPFSMWGRGIRSGDSETPSAFRPAIETGSKVGDSIMTFLQGAGFYTKTAWLDFERALGKKEIDTDQELDRRRLEKKEEVQSKLNTTRDRVMEWYYGKAAHGITKFSATDQAELQRILQSSKAELGVEPMGADIAKWFQQPSVEIRALAERAKYHRSKGEDAEADKLEKIREGMIRNSTTKQLRSLTPNLKGPVYQRYPVSP